jgi:hypothetical protein
MAVTIQADPSLAGYNCFCTLAEATDYHASRLHNESWTNASSTDKSMALVWASRNLSILEWKGARTSGTQLLAFPRVGLSYSEDGTALSSEVYDGGLGYYTIITVPSTIPPTEIKNAAAEMALWLIASDKTAESDLAGFKLLKVDSITIEPLAKDRPDWFVEPVRNLCKKFLKNSNKYNAPVVRV